MSEERFEDILESCLRMVQAGVSIDDCVARHPEHATGLREQLAAARVLAGRMPVRPEPAAVARTRAQFLGAVAQQREAASGQEPSFPLRALRRLVVVPYALPAALALLILGGAAMGVSATTGRGPMGGLFSSSSNTAETELEGIVTAVDCAAGTITIDDVTLLITEDTEFDDGLTCDEITPGMFVKVEVFQDEDAGLVAQEIEQEDEDELDEAQGPCLAGDADDSGDGGDEPNDNACEDEDGEDNSGPGNADDLEPRIEFHNGECELRGFITSLNPLVVNGVTVDDSSAARIRGLLAVGTFVRVKGTAATENDNRACVADEVEVGDEAEVEVQATPQPLVEEQEPRIEFHNGECELRGFITSLGPPLVVNGVTVDASSASEIRGDLVVGAFVRVKGTLVIENDNRICIADEIKVEDS